MIYQALQGGTYLFFAAASPTPLTIPITKHAIAPGQRNTYARSY